VEAAGAVPGSTRVESRIGMSSNIGAGAAAVVEGTGGGCWARDVIAAASATARMERPTASELTAVAGGDGAPAAVENLALLWSSG
jgi:hypothetical protein